MRTITNCDHYKIQVEEIGKPVQHYVRISFGTFLKHIFCSLQTRHISTFQVWLVIKIFDIGLNIILKNFIYDYYIVLRLPCSMSFLCLVCGDCNFLKKTVLKWQRTKNNIVKCLKTFSDLNWMISLLSTVKKSCGSNKLV